MRVLIVAAALGLLAGCASMEERRIDGPASSFTSSKGLSEVSECVLFAWQGQSFGGNPSDAFLQPLPGGGKTVVTASQLEFADFKPVQNSTKVDVYFQGGLMDWRKNKRIEAVHTCL
jgi:hypothetical protein